MSTAEESLDHVGLYFALALIAFVPLILFAPWASLLVPGFATATPLRRDRLKFAALWTIGGLITALFVLLVVGLLLPATSIYDGPVHQVR